MNKEDALAVFENFKIRRRYDEDRELWLFSVVDIIAALIQQSDYQTARKYWNKLKSRLKKEGSQLVTDCHQLKLEAADVKNIFRDFYKKVNDRLIYKRIQTETGRNTNYYNDFIQGVCSLPSARWNSKTY